MKLPNQILSCATVCAFILTGCNVSSDPLAVGSVAPDFKVVQPGDLSKSVLLSGLKGRVVLVDFWATWCAPCRAELPILQKLWNDNKSKGLEAVAISQDSSVEILNFQSETECQLPLFEDSDGSANKAFQVTGLPTTLLIGKDGHVLYSSVGYGDGVEAELQTAISKALE